MEGTSIKSPGVGWDSVDGTAVSRTHSKQRGYNIFNIFKRLVTLAEHTSDHGKQTSKLKHTKEWGI